MNRQTYATKFTGTVSRTGSRVTRVCPGSPRCLFTGNVWAPSLLGTGKLCLWVWVDGCEVRPCDPFARVRPCVPCVPCVSRLPPVSFYR